MKKLKNNQLGPWCSYCEPKTERATHRKSGFSSDFCCDNHKEKLKGEEVADHEKDRRYTEADSQTWGNL